MDELEKLVRELEAEKDKEHEVETIEKLIEKKLQEIGAKLIKEYEVKVGSLIIKPLLVEAYYYNENFRDDSAHAANPSNANTYKLARHRQKNHYGELYVHYGTKDGIDIVLSNGDYYLSFLIKNALVYTVESPQCANWAKQCKVSEMLCGNCNGRLTCEKGMTCIYYGEKILKSVNIKNYEIVFTKRKNLKNSYAEKALAALPINKIRDYPFTAGESSTEIIRSYIEKQISMKDYDEDKLKGLAKGLISWKTFEELE